MKNEVNLNHSNVENDKSVEHSNETPKNEKYVLGGKNAVSIDPDNDGEEKYETIPVTPETNKLDTYEAKQKHKKKNTKVVAEEIEKADLNSDKSRKEMKSLLRKHFNETENSQTNKKLRLDKNRTDAAAKIFNQTELHQANKLLNSIDEFELNNSKKGCQEHDFGNAKTFKEKFSDENQYENLITPSPTNILLSKPASSRINCSDVIYLLEQRELMSKRCTIAFENLIAAFGLLKSSIQYKLQMMDCTYLLLSILSSETRILMNLDAAELLTLCEVNTEQGWNLIQTVIAVGSSRGVQHPYFLFLWKILLDRKKSVLLILDSNLNNILHLAVISQNENILERIVLLIIKFCPPEHFRMLLSQKNVLGETPLNTIKYASSVALQRSLRQTLRSWKYSVDIFLQ